MDKTETEHFGLDSYITRDDLKYLIHQTASTLLYVPPSSNTLKPSISQSLVESSDPSFEKNFGIEDIEKYFVSKCTYTETYGQEDFLFVGNEEEGHVPVKARDFIEKYMPKIAGLYSDNYLTNPVYLQPPPVHLFHAVYGVNAKTEIGLFLKDTKLHKSDMENPEKIISKGKLSQIKNFEIKKGVVYEASHTKQKILESLGIKTTCSGDGTVPYLSLFYPINWKNHIPEMRFTEFENTSHMDTYYSQQFFGILAENICQHRQRITYSFHNIDNNK